MTTVPATPARSYSGPYAVQVNQAARANGLDPFLLAGLISHESSFDPNAVSPTGDYGLGQINLASHPTVTAAQAKNPAFAIPWVAHYLASLKAANGGSMTAALRAYNTGSGAPSLAGNTYASSVMQARAGLLGRVTAAVKAVLGALAYPVGVGAKIIGTPYQGTHVPGATTPASWQSDNAVDLAVPAGTPVYAIAGGTIGADIGAQAGGNQYTAGQRLTLTTPADAFWYGHLSRIVVGAGQQVQAGQLLGYSGSANGVDHLHLAEQNGNPLNLVNALQAGGATPGAGPVNATGNPQLASIWSTIGGLAGGTVLGPVGQAAGSVAGKVASGASSVTNAATDALLGPFKAIVAPFVSIGTAADRFVKDPAYPFLWIGFMLVGLALVFVGAERLLGRSAGADARGAAKGAAKGAAVVAAPEAAPVVVGA